MHGASLGTIAAADTFFIVDDCKIMLNVNCVVLAGLLAFSTADTAVCTRFSRYRTLIVIGAENNNARSALNEMNNVIGTNSGTHTTTDTELRINLGNTVFD